MGVMNTYGFPFPSVDGDRQYSSLEWREYFSNLLESGIVGAIANELGVKPQDTPNKTVYVDTGAIVINGAMLSHTEPSTLSFSDNVSGNPRIDRVIARLNLPSRKIELVVVEGSPSVSPEAPELVRNASTYELSLAQVAIANGYSAITTAEITDERADESLCGYFKYRAKPAWYPEHGDVPIDAWMYVVFKSELTSEEISDIEANPTLMDIINNSSIANAVSETITVNVATEDAQSVVGQVVTMTDLTVPGKTETYTLAGSESGATFRVIVGHSYYISVDDKSGYAAPPSSSVFTATAGATRSVTMTYEIIRRYGYKRDKTNSDPAARITYLHDAVLMTPAYMNFSTGSFDEGSWGSFVEEVCRPVMLKTNGEVDYELDREDFTKKSDGVTASDVANTSYDGNVMIEFRKYRWVKRYEDAGYEYVIFSNAQYDEDYKADAFTNENDNVQPCFYWGAFKGSNIASKLRSIAGQTVMVSQTRNTEVSYAAANGEGYYTIYKSGWDHICDLLTLISKSDHGQDRFGTGRSKSTNTTPIATGTLKDQPMFKGYNNETSDVKVFGIEGFWGNVWEGMAGLVLNSGIKTKMTPPYNFDGAGYTATGITPSGTSGGYISSASVTAEAGFVPKVASGSATQYYCDGLWYNNSQIDYAIVGGHWAFAGLAGPRCVALNALASNTNADLGSRLSYLNPA